MASIFYFHTDTAVSPKPSARQSTNTITHWLPDTNGGGQDGTSSFYPLKLLPAVGSATQTDSTSYTEPGSAHQGWIKAFVSGPLATQTFNPGTAWINFDMGEGNAAHNMFVSAFGYIWKGDNTGIRGILFGTAAAPWVDATAEANVALGTLQSSGNATCSSVSVVDGDVLVVELQFNDNNTKSASYLHAFGYNNAVGSNYDCKITFSTDLALKVTTITTTDVLSVATQAITVGKGLNPTDSLSIANQTITIGKGTRPTDVLTLGESVTVGKNVKITDSLASADTIYRHKTVTMSDSLGIITENILKGNVVTITDSLHNTDSVLAGKNLKLTDVLGSTDSVKAGKNLKLTDLLTSSDVIYRHKTVVIADSLSSVDITGGNKTLLLPDLLAIVNEVVTATNMAGGAKQVADSLAIAELLGIGKNLKLTDALGILDSVKTGKGLKVTDLLHLADNVLTHKGIIVTDSTLATDSLGLMAKTLKMSDVLSMLDTVYVGTGGGIHVFTTDTLHLTELISIFKLYVISVSDNLYLTDRIRVVKPYNTKWGLRGLVGQAIINAYSLPVRASVYWDDEPREVQAFIPLVKVYVPKTTSTIVGLGYGNVKVGHKVVIDIKARTNYGAYAAVQEVIRILGSDRITPFAGYDFLEFNDGVQHAGYSGFYWWTVEVTVWQIRRPVS